MIFDKSLAIKSFLIVASIILLLFLGSFLDVQTFGLKPRTFTGIANFLLFPFIHSSGEHLISNLSSLVPLLILLVYFCDKVAFNVLGFITITNALGVFLIGRAEYVHVGCSGIVYGLSSFLLTISILRLNKPAIVIFLLTLLFSYDLYIGVIPSDLSFISYSWESHFVGFLSGVVLGFFLGKKVLSNYHIDLC